MTRRCNVTKDNIRNSECALATSNTNVKNSINTIRNIVVDISNEIESHVISTVFNNNDVFEVSGYLTKCIFFFR